MKIKTYLNLFVLLFQMPKTQQNWNHCAGINDPLTQQFKVRHATCLHFRLLY